MNRILAGSLVFFIVCCSGICFGSDKAVGEHEPQNSQDQTGKTKRIMKQVGPFEIGGKRITVMLDVTEQEGYAPGYNAFEIKDEAGVSHYEKVLGPSVDFKGVSKLEGKSGEGLIFFFDEPVNAPPAGESFQIFGMEKGKVKPLSLPVSIYGKLQPLPKIKSEDTVSLFNDDVVKIEVYADFINVIVPLKVNLQNLTIVPLTTKGIFGINLVDTLNTPCSENQMQTDVKFYHDHNRQSELRLIKCEDLKKVFFISAFANVQLKEEYGVLIVDVSDLWLKVKINGNEGWVNDIDSFVTLGLPG